MAWNQDAFDKAMGIGQPKTYGTYGGSGGGEGKPFYTGNVGTGYKGTNQQFGTPGISEQDLAMLQWAASQSQGAAESGLDRLGSGQFLGGTLGQGAQSNYLNPTGMDPAVLERMKSDLASMFAGAKKDQLGNAEARANAGGAGQSAGLERQLSNIENQNLAELAKAILGVDFQNEGYKLQQSGTAAGLTGNLASLEAAMNQAYAGGQLGRVFTGYEPGGPGASGGGYKYINERGEIIPRQGWTAYDYAQALKERERFVNSGGKAAA